MEFNQENIKIVDKMFDEILSSDTKDFKNNNLIIVGIELVYNKCNPFDVIDDWIRKEFTKKLILLMINDNL